MSCEEEKFLFLNDKKINAKSLSGGNAEKIFLRQQLLCKCHCECVRLLRTLAIEKLHKKTVKGFDVDNYRPGVA